eukprot:SAG22_NODE_556_length_9120_cov_2.272475_5_plen_956_part_00
MIALIVVAQSLTRAVQRLAKFMLLRVLLLLGRLLLVAAAPDQQRPATDVGSWTVENDTDYLGAYRYSSRPAAGIGQCAQQCVADSKCVATSWNSPHSRQPNRLCNFVCSGARKHHLSGEIAAAITARAGDNRCGAPSPPPPPSPPSPPAPPLPPHRWTGPTTVPGVVGPAGTAAVIVDGQSIPAHWFTGGPFNAYTGAPSESPPPLTDAAQATWINTVQAASDNGIRIFEPLLNQWKLDSSTADGITTATADFLDSTLQVRSDFKGSDHCLSFCFSAFPCGSTALTADRCNQVRSDALFVLRIHICPEVGHMYREGQRAGDPPTDDGAHLPSPADPEWITKASVGLIALLQAIDTRYPGKIIGVHLTALQSGEWSQPVPAVGNTDYGESFRTLYCAKMNESASCVLPNSTERSVVRTGTASICAASPNTAADRAVGFNMLHNDDVSFVLAGVAKNVKAATDGKLLLLIFYGYLQAGSYASNYAADMVAYGHLSGKALLESPDIDGWVSPFEYTPTERLVTSPLGPEKLFSSLAHHGKLAMIEDDTRTNLDPGHGGFKWCYTLDCTTAMMRRDVFAAGVTGRGIYNFDLQGAGWLGRNGTADERGNTSAIWKAIGSARDALAKATPLVGPLGLPQIAVFEDERAPLTQRSGQGQWGMKNINQELLRMGAPHRSYYVDDIVTIKDKASIRLAIFPNLLTPSQAVKAALAAWQQDASTNTTFVFYGPAGLVQSDVRSWPVSCVTDTSAVPMVTGIPELSEHVGGTASQVQLKSNFTAAEMAAFPGIAALSGTVYGEGAEVFSPLMTVAGRPPAGVMVLGNYKQPSRQRSDPGAATEASRTATAALVAKARAGGGYNVYSAANNLPSTLFTALARSSGGHIFSDRGTECGVQASGNSIFVQAIGPSDKATRSGFRHVTLPQPLLVTSENGTKVCATACRSFSVDLASGHSELFIVEKAA